MKYLLIALIVMCSACSAIDKKAIEDCIKDEVIKAIDTGDEVKEPVIAEDVV